MTDAPSEFDLHAYVDNQLDATQRFAVEAHLSRNPVLAAKVMGDLSASTALRLLADDSAPVPDAMREQATELERRSSRSFWRKALPIGGGVGLAAGLSALLLVPDRPPAYVDMAVASHRVAMMRAKMASQHESPTLDHGEILASTRIDLPVLPANWRVTDVQLFPTGSGPALLVAVRTAEDRNLSLFVLRGRSDAPAIPDAVREGSQSVAYWQRGPLSYALTGEDRPEQIDATAERLNRSWS